MRQLGIAVVLGVLLVATPAQARVEFRVTTPLTAEVGTPARFAVCNTGRTVVRGARLVAEDLGLARADGTATGLVDVAPATSPRRPRPFPLRPGRCAAYALLVRGAAIASGAYDGWISIVTRGQPVARRKVTVSVATADKPRVTALADDLHLRARASAVPVGRGDAELPGSATVALVSKDRYTIPGCRTTPQQCFVGNLTHGADVASVFVTDRGTEVPATQSGDGRRPAWIYHLRITGADQIGDYTGTLDLGDGGKDSAPTQKVTVAVGVDETVPLLIVLAIGLGGLLLYWWLMYHRPKKALEDALTQAAAAYTATPATHGVTGMAGDDPDDPPGSDHDHRLTRPDTGAINGYRDDALAALHAYTDSVVVIDRSSDAWRTVRRSAEILEQDVAAWNGIRDTLAALRPQVLAANAQLLPDDDVPTAVADALSLFASHQLGVGDATARNARAAACSAVLERLTPVLRRRHRVYELLERTKGDTDPEHRAARERARAILDGVEADVWPATTVAELDAARVDAKLRRARDLLECFAPPPPDATPMLTLVEQRGPTAFGLDDVLVAVSALVFSPASAARIRAVGGRAVDVVVALVITAATAFTAYTALGIDDTWGTTTDYLVLLAAAILAPSAGLAGLTAANRLRLMRADPLVEQEATPASA